MSACQSVSPQRIAAATPAKRCGLVALLSFFGQPLRLWKIRRRDQRELQRMPDHLLRDMGIDAATVRHDTQRSFWQL